MSSGENIKIFKDESILCFAGEDWWYHNPHSNLHIMKSMAKHNKVLFINSIGIRMPSAKTDSHLGQRIARKLRSMLKYLRKVDTSLWVFTPIALPIIARFEKVIFAVNKVLLLTQLRVIMFFLGFKNPIIWVSLPTVKDVVLSLRRKIAKSLVYYCTDNISFFSGQRNETIHEQETAIHKAADVAFFVNHNLLEEKGVNPNTHFLSHGSDYEHFEKVRTEKFPMPEDLKNIPQPILGYTGVISRSVDADLIEYLAQRNPSWSFVFVGGIQKDIEKLEKMPNIYFLGKKPYEELPAYLQYMDVCCMYYLTNNIWIQSCNPKKTLEYLATGKPFVCVDFPEIHYFKDCVYIAKNKEEFETCLKTALHEKSTEKTNAWIKVAQEHTWDHIAQRAGALIQAAINKRN